MKPSHYDQYSFFQSERHAVRSLIVLIALFLTTAGCEMRTAAQVPFLDPEVPKAPKVDNGGLQRFGTILRRYGVESKADIRSAISSDNAELRTVAAYKLAEDKDTDALEVLSTAFNVEEDPSVKIDIAAALGTIQPHDGISRLEAFCSSTHLSISLVLKATSHLAPLKSPVACADRLITELEGTPSDDVTMAVLPRIVSLNRNIDDHQLLRAKTVVRKSLSSHRRALRVLAGESLLRMSPTEDDISELRGAIEREPDPGLRSIMQGNVEEFRHRQVSSVAVPAAKPRPELGEGFNYYCPETPCPEDVEVVDTETYNLASYAAYNSGIGIRTYQAVFGNQPSAIYNGQNIPEQVSDLSSSCPKTDLFAHTCEGSTAFIVGVGGCDNLTPQTCYQGISGEFPDTHISAYSGDFLASGPSQCQIKCDQKYTCGGDVIAEFTITRRYVHDFVGPIGFVTDVLVSKDQIQ